MIKYFDIFAGIGGLRSGLEKAGGFECVGYCEVDKYAKKAYETMYATLAAELDKYVEQLYGKIVPQNVRDFIDMMSAKKPARKQKNPAPAE